MEGTAGQAGEEATKLHAWNLHKILILSCSQMSCVTLPVYAGERKRKTKSVSDQISRGLQYSQITTQHCSSVVQQHLQVAFAMFASATIVQF